MKKDIDEQQASEIVMAKLDKISEILTVLFDGWFRGMANLNARDSLRGIAIWDLIGEDLKELVEVIHEAYGDGTEFEQAVREQEAEWQAQSEHLEAFMAKLEGLRQNARNN